MPVKLRLKHSATADKAPLPTDLLDGELALNTNSTNPAVYIKDSTGAVRKIAGIAIGTTAPAAPTAGMAWLDTTVSAKPTFKVYDGAAWRGGGSGINTGNTAPASPNVGDLWVDTTAPAAPVLKVYNGTSFASATPDATTTAKGVVQLADAAAITAGAAGRVVDAAQLKASIPATVTVPNASETVRGIVELATAAETTTGTDATRAVHPAGLKVELDKCLKKNISTLPALP